MNELRRRIAALPPEKRAVLARKNPLSFAQRRYWFMFHLEPERSATYNVPAALRFAGPLDAAAFRRALAGLVERHAVLRTSFPAFDGQPLQMVAPIGPTPLLLVDLTALPLARREDEAQEVARQEAAQPFDLEEGPVFRALLVRLGEEDHAFAVDLHHIICDGWSQEILVRELAELYAAGREGRPHRLPPLPIQYVDYARWQAGATDSADVARQVEYWLERLAGLPPALDLPSDRPRSAGVRRGSHAGVALPGELAEGLRRLAREAGASLFMTGMALFQTLLFRYTRKLDLAVGSPLAARPRTETEGLIGLFQRILVLRADLSGSPTFRELLARIRERTLEGYDHADAPFDVLVEKLQPVRIPGVHPLFQVTFTQVRRPGLQIAAAPAASAGNGDSLTIRNLDLVADTSKYDLSLALTDTGSDLHLGLQYDIGLFDRPTAERLLAHYQGLAAAAATDPGSLIERLPLLTEAERFQVLGEWNDRAAVYPGGWVHQIIEARVDRDPEAVAVAVDGETFSYLGLERRVNRLANYLIRLGIGPESRVGIALERSLDAIVAPLAATKAGAACVPLDPEHPAERLAHQIEDAGVSVVLSRSGLPLPETAVRRVDLDRDRGAIAACPGARPAVPVDGDNALYVLYTSGSTGRPKGAVNTHAAVRNRILWQQEELPITPEDRILQKTPFSFDVSVWELFWPLMTGARIVVAKPGGHLDPAYLADLVDREGVTVLHFVPPLLGYFLDFLDGAGPAGGGRCRTVRRILSGGEQLPVELARRVFARFPGASFHNGYGPTEAAIDVTFHRCRPDDRPPIPIGRPIANLRIEILDPALEPMPIGVPGEVWIGGVGLARGYAGRPDLTAERFRPDVYGPVPGQRLYKTGDLARFRTGGEIEFLGRLDHQIKIRGVRIEPGEIEAALEAHPSIGRALVLVLPDSRSALGGEKRLAAYLAPPAGQPEALKKVRRFGTPAGQGELRAFLEGKLPPAMVPSQIVPLDAFPLLASGKVDRKALPAPEEAALGRRDEEPEETAPFTPTQERVAALFEQVLQGGRMGLRDNFFDRGGHSILAVQAVARLRQAFGVEVPLRAVFESPTVAELTERIEALLRERAGLALPPLVRLPREGPAPLSFAQQRLWFLERLEPGNPFYNMSASVRLAGRLDPAVLAAALAEIVRRHEALRTTFEERDGEPFQVVQPPVSPELAVVDLSGLPLSAAEAEAHREANLWVRRPFDLTRAPLLRGVVLKLAPDDQAVVLTLHHIAGDGWSIGVLVREVSTLYTAFLEGRPSPLPELPVQYSDFARWQRGWLRGEALERLLAYWRERLDGALEPLDLPADRPRPPLQSHRGDRHLFLLPPDLGRGLTALGRSQGSQGATLFAGLMAGLQALLHRQTGRRTATVGFPVASRTHLELEPLIGFFVNTLVLRADPAPELPFRDLLSQVNEAAVSAYVHQDVPFEKLVEELEPRRSLAYAPLFQVMLALQNTPEPVLDLPEGTPLPFGTENGASRFDWTLFLSEARDGALMGSLEYSVDLFDEATVARATGHLRILLEGAVADPGRPLAELPLLSEEEKAQLRDWNAAPAAELPEPRVHRWVEDWAERTPEAVAVQSGNLRLTYRELVDRARELAGRLRDLGLGEGDPVAVRLERSPELLVALLGVLEAGGVYLPLDPSHPEERLRFQIEDAGAVAVVERQGPQGLEGLQGRREPGLSLRSLGSSRSFFPAPALAYLLYTSGSTGRPKGVAMGHAAIANLLAWQIARSAFPPGARTLSFSQPTFDVSFQEIFSTWGAGGTFVLIPEEERRDPAALLRALDREGIARLYLPAVALEGLAEEVMAGGGGGPRPAALREVITAGERLRVTPAVAAMFEALPAARLFNQYGPTETHVVTEHPLAGPPRSWEALPPIGRPVPGATIQILPPGSPEPAPLRVAGELCVGGAALARGYVGRADLTAERFVPDPFGEPGGRLYRTGDLARRRPGGEIEFLGRIDDQLKVRGFRVEPGEVEVALGRHPGVRQAVAGARGGRLVAWIVPEGDALDLSALRAALERELPEYMVPSSYMAVADLPLTRTGKVDRRALPDPGLVLAGEGRGYEAPRTAAEEIVAGVFAEVLGLERVGVHDGFFDLGGHSLVATRAMARLRQAFGPDLPLRRIFEHPTAAALAAALEAGRRGGVPEAPVRRVSRDLPLPLSFGQRRLWFLDRFEPGSAVYNMPLGVRLEGDLDVAALAWGLEELVRRHEALRTTFQEGVGGEPVQVVGEPACPLPVVDLTALPAPEPEARRLAEEEAARPFDLARGPLIRASLVQISEGHGALLLNTHHTVSDGWSQGILVRDLTEFYAAARERRAPRLPELPVQYADYAVWQREQLSGDRLGGLLRAWRDRLRGAPAALDLPADRPRPAVQTFRGARRTVRVSGPRLRAVTREESVTPFMLVFAAFAALLGRLSGQDDVVVGTPIANRQRVELEGLIGFFVNTLALRVRLATPAGEPSFRTLLARVRETALDAYAHQDLPFERLVEELSPERDLSRSPLFQALLVLQNAPAPAGDTDLPLGLRIGLEGVEEAVAKFDLTLAVEESGEGLTATLNYNRDLFDAATAERWLAAWGRALTAAAADPATRIGDLPWLAPEERRQLVEEWGRGPEGSDRTALDRFEEQARLRPDAEALVLWDGGHLPYAELDHRAAALAGALAERGVQPGDRVGVCLPRSPEAVIAFLAIWKAGAAYVPLDPTYPGGRLWWLAQDAGIRIVVGWIRPLDGVEFVDPAEAGPPVRREALPGELACVMYTSGSTGEPKGVAVTHRGLGRLVAGGPASFAHLGPDETFLQLAPLSFDAATFEIWGALAHGGRLALMPPENPTLAELGAALGRFGVTTLWLTAGLFHLMVDERLDDLGGLRQLLAGGDVLSPAHAARLRAAWPGVALIDGYGPTESTTFTTTHRISEADPSQPVPIGRPIAGTRVAILDAELRPVPPGVAGELCAGGAGLARGYLGRPDLTAERFVPDPLHGPGERLYRTGDRARWRPDGSLDFLGRADLQVKVRGHRVEPAEIEAVLAGHPEIRDAAVVLQGDSAEERRLVACVVPRPGAGSDPAAWRAWLAERLPDPMVPSAFRVLTELPLTPNGKVDRAALARLAPREEGGAGGTAEPRGLAEEILAAIWSEILGVETIGREDGFFDLGGHSLLAAQIMSRVRQAFGVELPLRDFFAEPTVRAFAARVEAERIEREADRRAFPPPPLVPVGRSGPLPLSFAQQRLWFLDRWEPASPAYNIPTALRLEGTLRPDVLARVLAEVVRRHETLRTVFEAAEGVPVQIVRPAGDGYLPRVDLEALSPEAREREAGRLAREEAGRPFDLMTGPVFRATLVRLGEADHAALLTVHHVASDGWSQGILIREVGALYAAFAAGEPSPLPELPVQYADYAVWQRDWLSGEGLEAQVEHWRGQLAGAPAVLDLPADRPRPAVRTSRGATLPVALPADLARSVRGLARHEGATPFMVLLGVFQALLGRLAGVEDLTVGTPVAGRNRVETEGLIGFFVNTLVLRADLAGAPSLRALLARVRETALEAHAHQDLPFEKLVEALEPERDPSHTPLFQVVFALQNAPRGGLALPGLRARPLGTGSATAKFDLTLSLTEGEDGLHGSLEYSADLFDPATAERLLAAFQALLAGALQDPDRPLHEIAVLEGDWTAAARTALPSAPPSPETGEAGPPRDSLERELAEIWESVLGVPVDRAARFFDLGGHSLLAVRLLSRIGKRFGRDLPLATLFAAPTIARLAAVLRTGGGASAGALVPIQPEGTEPPFFCVHPAGGSVLAYRELARHLGTGRPFYGIQAIPAGGGIPALADLYLKDVLRLQPAGPYHLGGWSMGALVAFEMACRLEHQGKEVALLALLDPTPLGALPTLSTEEGDLLAGFVHDLTGLGQLQAPDLDLEAWRPHFETYRANLQALKNYRPGLFHGRAHLFLAREGQGEDWSAHLADVPEIHPVPGGHYGLLREPEAREWGGRLREVLDQAAKPRIPQSRGAEKNKPTG